MTPPVNMSFLLKAAALVVFLAAIGGATYAVQMELGESVSPLGASLRADAVHPTLNGTAGHAVTFALTVSNRGLEEAAVVARLAGDGFEGASAPTLVLPEGNRTAFVTIPIGASAAPGTHALTLTLESAEGKVLRTRPGAATLRVMDAGPGFGDGVTADIVYVGRVSDGSVFNTNDAGLLPLNFAKSPIYQPSEPGGFELTGSAQPTVVPGFYELLLGMQAGESRTATVPAEKAYGPRAPESSVNRTETIPRDYALPIRNETVPRSTFDEYVIQTNQGADWSAGEIFIYEQGSNRWPYLIESINDTTLVYHLSVEAGQTYTLYPFWSGASEVVSSNATAVLLRTTPATPVGSAFTMRSYWPDMTTLVDVNPTSIVVRHDPPVGFQYSMPSGGPQGPIETTVKSLSDDKIVTTTPSGNPLAGEDLTFDVFIASLRT